MYCHNCGKQIPEISKYCRYCGTAQIPEENIGTGSASDLQSGVKPDIRASEYHYSYVRQQPAQPQTAQIPPRPVQQPTQPQYPQQPTQIPRAQPPQTVQTPLQTAQIPRVQPTQIPQMQPQPAQQSQPQYAQPAQQIPRVQPQQIPQTPPQTAQVPPVQPQTPPQQTAQVPPQTTVQTAQGTLLASQHCCYKVAPESELRKFEFGGPPEGTVEIYEDRLTFYKKSKAVKLAFGVIGSALSGKGTSDIVIKRETVQDEGITAEKNKFRFRLNDGRVAEVTFTGIVQDNARIAMRRFLKV